MTQTHSGSENEALVPEGKAEDVTGPAPSGSATTPAADAVVGQLREALNARDRKLDEVLRAYSALKNEQAEFRQRLQRERERLIDVERGKVAMTLLETADELDRALKASSKEHSPLAQGIRFVRESLGRKLSEMGIEPLSLLGKPFDPNVAEAVDTTEVSDPAEDGVVLDEVTRGFTISGKLLRPARVRVGRLPVAPSVSE